MVGEGKITLRAIERKDLDLIQMQAVIMLLGGVIMEQQRV